MNSQRSSCPDFTISPRPSTMCVCGVIGYAQITSGRHSAIASAVAADPSICLSMGGLFACTPRMRERLGGRGHVAFGDGLGKLFAYGRNDGFEPHLLAQRGKRAEQRRI